MSSSSSHMTNSTEIDHQSSEKVELSIAGVLSNLTEYLKISNRISQNSLPSKVVVVMYFISIDSFTIEIRHLSFIVDLSIYSLYYFGRCFH